MNAPIHSFGGEPPFDARFDLKELLLLPEEAQPVFSAILSASLGDAIPPHAEQAAKELCTKYDVSPARLLRATSVCRLLFREGAKRAVTPEQLAGDLHALVPEETERLVLWLIPHYTEVLPRLRQQILYSALTDHGQLLTGVAWRVDEMRSSQRGVHLQAPVTHITLTYLDGKEEKRVTVQALPDMLRLLRALCDSALGPAR